MFTTDFLSLRSMSKAKKNKQRGGKQSHPLPSLLQDLLQRSNAGANGGQPARKLELALEDFAMSGGLLGTSVPDYQGFSIWLNQLASSDPAMQLVFNRTANGGDFSSITVSVLEEMRKLGRKYRDALESHRGDAGIKQLRIFNKLKLITHILNSSPRGTDFAAAMEREVPAVLDEHLSMSTQADLRLRLFAATQRKEWRTAFKIIGALKEEAHHPGELEFLEAMALFHSDDLNKCISYASKVGPNHIDYRAAKALQLECLAYCGRVAQLVELVEEVGASTISPMFFRYLGQLLALNAPDPENALKDMNDRAIAMKWQLSTISNESDPFFIGFNRHSCAVALRFAEWLEAHDVAMNLSRDNEQDDNLAPDSMASRLQLALCAFDPDFAVTLVSAPRGQRYIPIVKRLMNVGYESQLADYAQALETQWRLGGIVPFVDNIARMLPMLRGEPVPAALVGLTQTAYVEAASRKLPAETAIMSALSSSGIDCSTTLTKDVQHNRMISVLSPMSKLSYTWAESALEAAEQSDSFEGDAGMIALGFFRILEHELNDLLIAPFRSSPSVQMEIEVLWARVGEALSNEDTSLSKKVADKRKKAHVFWTQLIERLVPVLEGKLSGLELGSLRIFLGKASSISGDDLEVKQYFASKLCSNLNSAGRAALMNGDIAKFIEQSAVEKFRNPPAHSRFVSLATARKCKDHVDRCLAGLAQWRISPQSH
ncbi:hypothetical protein BN2476_230358 [Paraburkholderia piptadeniae]|uniref:Uncharacterized protein n=1 Tax=Paraburkholderia piptadeniae TaxID=1701573 RepID=A0A1N7RY73_9BURK|nr:hypothetical protein [Paraburkholderia piptadeniae]SIT40041.1 hypothetical protein BN2476_230358 [Paraburkholderia piptadeniae]